MDSDFIPETLSPCESALVARPWVVNGGDCLHIRKESLKYLVFRLGVGLGAKNIRRKTVCYEILIKGIRLGMILWNDFRY